MKYFNFLLENEINFTKDENGDYVALIKILNPQFYKNEKAREKIMQQDDDYEEDEEAQVHDNTNIVKNNQKSTSPLKGGKNVKNTSKSPIPDKGKGVKKEEKKTVSQVDPKGLFGNVYQKFLRTLQPMLGVRGKKLNYYNLKYMIEEIYSIRFIKDTSNLRNQLVKQKKAETNEEVETKDPFPIFVVEFLINKYVKKNLVDGHALDILTSVEFFKTKFKEIEIFYKFLNEEYDTDDLIFFLFVRSCIEKEMKIMFIEKAREEIKIQYNENREDIDTETYLNVKNCLKIANTIFGNEEEILLNSFMEKIEKNLISNQKKGKNLIKASTILEITLEDYHESRKLYGQTSNMNFENFKNKNESNKNNEEMFEDNEMESEYTGPKKINFAKAVSQNQAQNVNTNQSKSGKSGISNNAKREDKINYFKNAVSDYIRDKELNIFFDRIMESYTYSEKENEFIDKTIANIKDLVAKKMNVLINIIFNQDRDKWFMSLQIKDPNEEQQGHFNGLIQDVVKLIDSDGNNEALVENVGQNLISTKELINQIQKLVFKYLS
jgi:hypothetical protein